MEEAVKARFEDVKARFEDLDKRISSADKRFDDLNKRFDDVKWVAGSVSILLSVLAVLAGFNFTNERAALRDSLKELREEVGKVEVTPNLEMVGLDGQTLSGQEVPGHVSRDNDAIILSINFILRNIGSGTTGPMWVKLYSSSLSPDYPSSDEPKFKYEAIVIPKSFGPGELPGKMSAPRYLNVGLASPPEPGKHCVPMKHYYGKGMVASASFIIVTSGKGP